MSQSSDESTLGQDTLGQDTPGQDTHDKGTPDPADQASNTAPRKGLGLRAVLSSTIAAAIGVQSSDNRRRDFEQGRARDYIFAGIAFTIVFVLTMIFIVRTVLGDL